MEPLAAGLWRWSTPHPGWRPGHGWEERVASYYVAAPGAALLIDPLIHQRDGGVLLSELDSRIAEHGEPVHILLSRAGHFRSSQLLHDRYDAPVWGHERGCERLSPTSDYRVVDAGAELPGESQVLGYRQVYDATPLFVRSHAAIVPGDMVVAVGGELRFWWVSENEHDEREYQDEHLPSLAPWLELPIEHVLVSHGEYVAGGGRALAGAFSRPPWAVS